MKIPHNPFFSLFAISLLLSLFISWTFYPGFMNWDSTHALLGAREGVTNSVFPPMVSYVWRVVDYIHPNPSAMLFVQNFLMLLSTSLITYFFLRKLNLTIFFLFFFLTIPAILGIVAVIFKDVLMAACLLFGFILSVYLHQGQTIKLKILLILISLFFLLIAVCVRHNAIAAAAPLLFYLSYKILNLPRFNFSRGIYSVILAFVLISFTYGVKLFLDNYSLPNLARITNINQVFISSVKVLDIAGASLCQEENFFKKINEKYTLEELRNDYDPKHINLSKKVFEAIEYNPIDRRKNDQINFLWRDVAIKHPICILSNKFELFKYSLGANRGNQFLITDPELNTEERDFGFRLQPSNWRDFVVRYIVRLDRIGYLKPWLMYFFSIFYFIKLFFQRQISFEIAILFISAIFYFFSQIIFGNAADARLLFYPNSIMVLILYISTLIDKKTLFFNYRNKL